MSTHWMRKASLILCLCLPLWGCQSSDSTDTVGTSPAEGTDGPDPGDQETAPTDDRVQIAMAYRPANELCDSCPALEPFSPSTHAVTSTVQVSAYGASGDGTPEHSELQRAIDAAGDGGRVVFESGRTYHICKMLTARPNQHWLPSGTEPATLKRCDTPVTTLTADVSAGSTALPVASTAGFEAGMWVSPVRAGSNDFYAGEISHHPIYAINGNVLNVYQTFEKSYQAGDKVVLSFAMIKDNDGALFEGLIFDGNAAGNDHFVSWARHTSLWLTSIGSRANNNQLINAQGDAISVQGLDNIVENNAFSDLNGSALHFSAARNTIVRRNQMLRTNLEAQRVVHAEASLTWSLGNTDILVENNCIQDIPEAALGHIIAHGNNSGADIRENQICNTDSLLQVASNQPLDIDLLFTDNHVRNAGTLSLLGLNTTISGIEITGNRFHNSAVYTKNVDDLLIDNNHMSLSGNADLGDAAESASNKYAAVTIRGGRSIDITDNFISGGLKGIQVFNELDRVSDVSITANSVTQHTEHGIIIGHPASIDSNDDNQSDFSGVSVQDNLVSSNLLALSDSAVELGRRAPLTGNCIESSGYGVALHGPTATTALTQIADNRINSISESLTASSPYTAGFEIRDNSASNGIAPALLASNASADTPLPLSAECDLMNTPTPTP